MHLAVGWMHGGRRPQSDHRREQTQQVVGISLRLHEVVLLHHFLSLPLNFLFPHLTLSVLLFPHLLLAHFLFSHFPFTHFTFAFLSLPLFLFALFTLTHFLFTLITFTHFALSLLALTFAGFFLLPRYACSMLLFQLHALVDRGQVGLRARHEAIQMRRIGRS